LGDVVRDLRYDEAERIKSYTHRSSASGAAANSWDQAFGYDELGRLTQVAQPGTAWSIAYDANGNRTSVSLNGSTSVYNTVPGSNKLAGTTNPVRDFTYDEAGNIQGDSGKGDTATYDLSGRLSAISLPNGSTGYTYDNFGQRIRKTRNAGTANTVLFMYGQDRQLLGEYDGTGKAIRESVWLAARRWRSSRPTRPMRPIRPWCTTCTPTTWTRRGWWSSAAPARCAGAGWRSRSGPVRPRPTRKGWGLLRRTCGFRANMRIRNRG
jgi:YD repeat-containing protein